MSDLSARLIAAIEGECGGLAITAEQASNILAYLQYGAPMDGVLKDAERYRKLRSVDINAVKNGGVFAGLTPDNVVINGEDLDIAVDLLIDDASSNCAQAEDIDTALEQMTRCINDPMWTGHAEVPKTWITGWSNALSHAFSRGYAVRGYDDAERPTQGADDTQVVIAGLNALLHDAQDEIARLTATQGADARPVAIPCAFCPNPNICEENGGCNRADRSDIERDDLHGEFEAAYRQRFPIASSLQTSVFYVDDLGEYREAKVFTAFALWQAARATAPTRYGYVYEWDYSPGVVHRSFDYAPYNGRQPDRTIEVFRAPMDKT